MSYIVDYSGDWEFTDGVQDVTYTHPDATTKSAKAKAGDAAKNAFGGGEFASSETAKEWTIWTGTLESVEVVVTGTITDGNGAVWQIVGVNGERSDGSQVVVITIKRAATS